MLNDLYAYLLNDGNLNRSGGLSPKSVRYIHTILHKSLADAVDADLLGQNVAERAKPPEPKATKPAEVQFWEPESYDDSWSWSKVTDWKLLGIWQP